MPIERCSSDLLHIVLTFHETFTMTKLDYYHNKFHNVCDLTSYKVRDMGSMLRNSTYYKPYSAKIHYVL